MRIHVLQQSEGTPPGSVLEWLSNKGHAHHIVHLYKGDRLPSLDETDWLIILGGAMNVDEVDKHPWLLDEKEFLKQAIVAKKTCLGLCLGGQLLSQVLGGTVQPHTEWEVGWHPVILGQDYRMTVFQWHQDTFSIPEGAVRVATNRTCENQGFAYGDNVVGLQFHPEATEEWIRSCVEDKDQPSGAHVQKADQIMENMIFLHPMKKWFFDLLDRMEAVTRAQLNGQQNAK